ncbi:MAG: serine acetyltransferase [Gammaproteobacteria bacterium]|nr:serine acetyltransferase [Gammaproteobacteria bacterium]
MSKALLAIHRIIFNMKQLGIPLFPSLINKLFIRLLFGCQIGVETKIGKNVDLGYGGLGVVIHKRAVIGDNVSIGSGVTIGGTTKKYDVPIIGDNTIISTGAKILGPIEIGKNCVIGANSVVLKSIPNNCVAVGSPAKIIKRNIDIENYKVME